MFDDIPQKNTTPPGNLPTEPTDMFAGVEEAPEAPSALDAGILKKKLPGTSVMPRLETESSSGETALYPAKAPVLGKIIMVVVILAIAGGVGYGAWWFYSSYIMKAPAKTTTTEQPDQPKDQMPAEETPEENAEFPMVQTTSTEETPTTTATGTTTGQEYSDTTDSDSDGLSDAREAELGTGVMIADTDRDSLSDGDEVLIWKTNPLNPDSDDDTYLDGEEVRHGYNPLGSGKLFNNTGATTTASTVTSTSEDEMPPNTSTQPSEPI